MSNHYFRFKQFTVFHDKCAMKVGTDGVLLGAWAPIEQAGTILDIGCGTGLISLMLAQRSSAFITGIDIDGEAVSQCRENVNRSKWNERIQIHHTPLSLYNPGKVFDLIVSNPPYFQDSMKSPEEQRNKARHTNSLSYKELFNCSSQLLNSRGLFCIVIPTEYASRIKQLANEHGLHPVRQTDVHTTPVKPAKRTLMAFSYEHTELQHNKLIIELSRHVYSEDYINLTRDFYLNM